MDNNKAYIFPLDFIIEKPDRVLTKEFLSNNDVECILIDCRSKEIYLINNDIRDFLLYFRTPHSFAEAELKYGVSEISHFFRLMLKANILIKEENGGKLNKYVPFRQNIFPEYKIIKIFKDTNYVLVALVEDAGGNRSVIKHLKTGRRRRRSIKFEQEFNIYKILGNSPYLCKLIKYDPDRRLAILEYIDGISLKDLIETGGLSIEEKIKLAKQIVLTCGYIHGKNVIHGDIHAHQFIVDRDLNIKILDFGYGYYMSDVVSPAVIIRGGCINYFEPENITPDVFDFNKFVQYIPSKTAEVYRLGVLLYFLFYEEYPIVGSTWKKYYKNVQHIKPQIQEYTSKNELIPFIFQFILKKCLQKDPLSRFESCQMLAEYYMVESLNNGIS